jgi:hypothetical protein
MLNRKIIFALTALASLGAAVLSSTSASALGGHGFGGGFSGRGMGGGHSIGGLGHVNLGGGHINFRPNFRPIRPRPPIFVRWPRPGIWWTHWHRPHYLIDPVVTERVVGGTVAPRMVQTDNCNCLTKEYLQDGSVMFKDLCTKEAAVATPDQLRAQAPTQ